jgi:hypothetical protein
LKGGGVPGRGGDAENMVVVKKLRGSPITGKVRIVAIVISVMPFLLSYHHHHRASVS